MNIEEELFSGTRKTSRFLLAVVAIFGIFVMLPVFLRGFPIGADFDNHFRFVLPLYEEIGRGNFLPGWLAESNFGYGDPRFRFYPPLLYYVLCLFRFLTGDWYFASVLVFALFSAVGALGVYGWTRRSLKAPTAALAAALFALAPYRLAQFYQASLLAEFAAAALLPYAFLFVEKLTTAANGKRRAKLFDVAALAAVFSLIVTTHIPTTVIGSLGLGAFALFSIDWKNNKKALLYCAAAIALGLIASSWFWIKMVSELSWIQAGEKVGSAYYDYRNNFIFSPFSPSNLNTWYGSFVAALTVGCWIPSIIVWRKIFDRDRSAGALAEFFADSADKVRRRLTAAFALTLFSVFMMTDLSRPVWALVPKLKDVQFPYRWLIVASIMICPPTALALSCALKKFREKSFNTARILLLAAFLGALGWTGYDLVYGGKYISREKFLQRIEEARGARSFNDWLPRGAREVKDLEPLAGLIDAGSRAVSVTDWQSHRRIFTVEAGAENSARLRTYHYPQWRAWTITDGQKIAARTERADDGTLLVALPDERTTIEVAFVEPARTGLSLIAAALGWLTIFACWGIYLLKLKAPKLNS